MKQIYILVMIIAAAAMSASAQVGKVFDKYDDTDGVTSVYVSKAMLSMIPDMKTGDVDLSDMAGKLDCVKILTSDNDRIAAKLKEEISKAVDTKSYEVLVKVNEGKERTVIYMKSEENGQNEYLILNGDEGNFNAILIEGKITPADIRKIARVKK